MRDQRLSTHDVATFAARGVMTLPGVVPEAINAAAIDECRQILSTWGTPERPNAPTSGQTLDELYPGDSAIGAMLRSDAVAGAIASLAGPAPRFDHDFVHLKRAGDLSFQSLHADAVIDHTTSFDIQLFYFPHAVDEGAGGTGYVPGTHLRRIHETQVGRYRHLRGEQQWSGPAGSVLIFHQGLWHRGMANPSGTDRLMYKIRLNPSEPQVRHWNDHDLDALQPRPTDHVFATTDADRLGSTLRHREPWMGEQDHRLEIVNRTRLWRYLTADHTVDLDWYLTRRASRDAIDRAVERDRA